VPAARALYRCLTVLTKLLKAKIHRATVTFTDVEYPGSVTVDRDLLDASGILVNEAVLIADCENGNRFETTRAGSSSSTTRIARPRSFATRRDDGAHPRRRWIVLVSIPMSTRLLTAKTIAHAARNAATNPPTASAFAARSGAPAAIGFHASAKKAQVIATMWNENPKAKHRAIGATSRRARPGAATAAFA